MEMGNGIGNGNGNKASCAFLQLIKIRPRSWLALSALLPLWLWVCSGSARGPAWGKLCQPFCGLSRSQVGQHFVTIYFLLCFGVCFQQIEKLLNWAVSQTGLPLYRDWERILHEQTKLQYTIPCIGHASGGNISNLKDSLSAISLSILLQWVR